MVIEFALEVIFLLDNFHQHILATGEISQGLKDYDWS